MTVMTGLTLSTRHVSWPYRWRDSWYEYGKFVGTSSGPGTLARYVSHTQHSRLNFQVAIVFLLFSSTFSRRMVMLPDTLFLE